MGIFWISAIQYIAHLCGIHISKLRNIKLQDPFSVLEQLIPVSSQSVIFDVGAHWGETCDVFQKRFPNAIIHAFEPYDESYAILHKKMVQQQNIILHNYGLSNANKDELFHVNVNSSTNSLLPSESSANKIWGEGLLDTKGIIKLPFKTLDQVAKDHQISKINLLKMDVQGAEHLVLEGAKEFLNQGKIDVIYSELILQNTYKGQKRLDEILKVIYEWDFEIHSLYNLNLSDQGKLRQLDAIFVRKE